MCGHAETRCRAQVVIAELYVDLGQCNVRAALYVRRASLRVVDRFAIDGDAHQVQAERVLRFEFTRQARDVHTFVVIEDSEFVVNDLHGNM